MTKGKNIIVNEHDEIIGYKERAEIVSADIYRITGLWIENSRGEILMAQRSFSKKNSPGKWGPAVSGTVEEGETYDSNVIKEAEEEIGLKDHDLKVMGKIRVYGINNYFAQWYFASLDMEIEDFIIAKDEVEALKWFSRNDLLEEIKNQPENFVNGIMQSAELLGIS